MRRITRVSSTDLVVEHRQLALLHRTALPVLSEIEAGKEANKFPTGLSACKLEPAKDVANNKRVHAVDLFWVIDRACY